MSQQTRVVIYSRTGCHLCEQALAKAQPVIAKYGAHLQVIDIDTDASAEQRAAYSALVPVVLINDEVHAHYRLDAEAFGQALGRCQQAGKAPKKSWLTRWFR